MHESATPDEAEAARPRGISAEFQVATYFIVRRTYYAAAAQKREEIFVTRTSLWGSTFCLPATWWRANRRQRFIRECEF